MQDECVIVKYMRMGSVILLRTPYMYFVYIFWYHQIMQIGITKLRQDLFRLADQALAGEPVSFMYKGVILRLVPDGKPSKLSRLTPRAVVVPKTQLSAPEQKMMQEMEKEWEQDWAEL